MEPREELRDVVWKTVTSDVLSLKDKATRITQHCDQFAIGRWVSVEERLPDESGPYIVQWSTKRESNPHDVWFDSEAYKDFGGWAYFDRYSTITHWLELDIPEVGE